RLAALIADLDSDEFTMREKAVRELEEFGEAAASACHGALKNNLSAETRRRLEAIVEKQSQELHDPRGDSLRVLRALEVLELTGSRKALPVLEALAKGIPEARLTREAKATRDRMARRGGLTP